VFGLAGELDGDLALKDALAVQSSNGTLGFSWRREVDEGIANWTGGARVDRNGDGFAVEF
jgi:hypothetical protein